MKIGTIPFMTRFLVVLILMTTYFTAHSQDDTETFHFPKYAVGITPTALVNFYYGYQIRNDFGLTDKIAVSLESAYINGSIFGPETRGYRLKPAINYVLKSYKKSLTYISFNMVLRHTFFRTTSEYNFRRYGYVERVDFFQERFLTGAEVSIGFMGKLSDRFLINFSAGAGGGDINILDSEYNPSREDGFDDIESQGEPRRESIIPIASISCTVSYIIL